MQFAPADALSVHFTIVFLCDNYFRRVAQPSWLVTLRLFVCFHLHTLLNELSKVHAQVDRLRSNNCLITAGEELEYLESAGFHVRGPILDEEGARELERIIHLDGLNVCLADGSFHLELLGL